MNSTLLSTRRTTVSLLLIAWSLTILSCLGEPVPDEPLLLNDFEHGHSHNGKLAGYGYGGGFSLIEGEGRDTTTAACVFGDWTHAQNKWGVLLQHRFAQPIDLTRFDAVSWWMRSRTPETAIVAIEFFDTDGQTIKHDPVELTTDYRKTVIPIDPLVFYNRGDSTNACRMDRVAGYNLLLFRTGGARGHVFVDDIELFTSPFDRLECRIPKRVFAGARFPVRIVALNEAGGIDKKQAPVVKLAVHGATLDGFPPQTQLQGGMVEIWTGMEGAYDDGHVFRLEVTPEDENMEGCDCSAHVENGKGPLDELEFIDSQFGPNLNRRYAPLVRNQVDGSTRSHLYTDALAVTVFTHAGKYGAPDRGLPPDPKWLERARDILATITPYQQKIGRFPNWFDLSDPRLFSDPKVSPSGNNSWFLVALGYYTLHSGDRQFVDALERLADYLMEHAQFRDDSSDCSGAIVFNPLPPPGIQHKWKPTIGVAEHQTEAYVGLRLAARALKDQPEKSATCDAAADRILDFIRKRLYKPEGWFNTAINLTTGEKTDYPYATDPQTWGVMAFGRILKEKFDLDVLPALDYVMQPEMYGAPGIPRPVDPADPAQKSPGWDVVMGDWLPGAVWLRGDKGIWLEGTAQLGCSLSYAAGQFDRPDLKEKAKQVFDSMTGMQHPSGGFQTFSDNFQCASPGDSPLGENQPAVIATAWRYFQIVGVNPYNTEW